MHASLGTDLIDVYAGGHLDQNAIAYLDGKSQELRATVGGEAAQFFNQARNLYQVISATDATQVLRNLKSKVDKLWADNTITNHSTLASIQTAGTVMQRWIMAHPGIRGMYLNQEVEGYSGSYVNYHGEAIGASHYDYRRVVDGIAFETEEGYRYTQYHEAITEDDPELTLHQKVDILNTWKAVEHYLDEADEDPTSAVGNKL